MPKKGGSKSGWVGICQRSSGSIADYNVAFPAPETLNRTNLGTLSSKNRKHKLTNGFPGELEVGSRVNLERAMGNNARYGGHFVQGHVDFTCTIVKIEPDGSSLRFTFQVPQEARQLATGLLPKGYVTLDGTSLTLTKVEDSQGEFGVMLIEHSRKMVVLNDKKVGDKVNVEVDTVAKGIVKVVNSVMEGEGGPLRDMVEQVVRKVLAEKGL